MLDRHKCDVNETELLEYLVADEDTGVIGCYLESIVDGKRFLELARSTSKPIVVLKAGRSEQGAKAAMSHTASLSGSAAVYEGAFRQAGIVQVHDVHELMDFSRGFSKITPCGSDGGTAVITFSGGAGIVTSDLLADRGLKLAEFSLETIAALKEVFPPWMQPSHPVDVWPSVELNGLEPVYAKAVEAVMKDPDVDSVIIESIAWDFASPGYLVAAGEMQKRYRKPIVLWQIGNVEISERYRLVAEEAGIPYSPKSAGAWHSSPGKAHYAEESGAGVKPPELFVFELALLFLFVPVPAIIIEVVRRDHDAVVVIIVIR